MTNFWIETDSLGEVKVPADKLWGAQTQRSSSGISRRPLQSRDLVRAIGTDCELEFLPSQSIV